MYNIEYINSVNRAIKQYLHEEKVTNIEDTKGGIANKVLKLTTDKSNKYILKIYKKRRNHMLANQLIDYLNDNKVYVSKPINSEYIIFEDTVCYLYNYIDNKETKINNELEIYILKVLKSISKFKNFNYLPEHLYKTKCDAEYEFLKSLKEYKLNKKDVVRVVKFYESIKEKPINNSLEIVHSDISTSNLLTVKNKYYLIDFDETRVTSKLYDLMVVLIKFYVKNKKIDFVGMKKFTDKYKEEFSEYSEEDYFEVFKYYICKQLLEKFYDYESGKVNIFSKQQMQDNFKNWIYYFNNINMFKKVFFGGK